MTLNQQPSNCRLITANDPVLASNFTMQPTFKIADKKVVLRDHNYSAVKDFVLSRSFMHCIRCQEKIEKKTSDSIRAYSIKPDFMFYDSDDEVRSSPFL